VGSLSGAVDSIEGTLVVTVGNRGKSGGFGCAGVLIEDVVVNFAHMCIESYCD
jgi:hypothetical protein